MNSTLTIPGTLYKLNTCIAIYLESIRRIAMLRRIKALNVLIIMVLLSLVVWSIASCGGGGGGGGGTQVTATKQAAASSSAAMGSVQLSATIGQASSMASGAIPAGYAPGKTSRPDQLPSRISIRGSKMLSTRCSTSFDRQWSRRRCQRPDH